MASVLAEAVEAATDQYPQAARFIRELTELSPTLLQGQITYMVQRHGPSFWREAERLVGLSSRLNGSPAAALVEYTVVYIKEQVRFLESREYAHQTFETALKEVYDNPDVMEKYYLEGLLLSHAFWPIHFDIHEFFTQSFLPRVPNEGIGAEFGFGHGLYLHDLLKTRPGATAAGFDISESSRKFAGRLLREAGIPGDRFNLSYANVLEPLPIKDGEYGWAIFAEIMEHIPDPLFSLRELRRCLKPKAPAFITTVVNSNAIDHLYLFREPGEVRRMLEDAGFTIAEEQAYRVADYAKNAKDPSIDLAYVALAGD